MTQVQEWSELYDIPEAHIATLHARDTYLGAAYNHLDLIKNIWQKNSELVLDFLASLPEPNLEDGERFGVGIDLILPTEEAMRVLLEDDLFPKQRYVERENGIATRYWDAHGTEFYFGPGESSERRVNLQLPTYVQTRGEWKDGHRQLIAAIRREMLGKEFLLYSFSVGDLIDRRDRSVDLSHDNVFIGTTPLWYAAADSHYYGASSRICCESPGMFWGRRECETIRDRVEALNQRFFRIEKDS